MALISLAAIEYSREKDLVGVGCSGRSVKDSNGNVVVVLMGQPR